MNIVKELWLKWRAHKYLKLVHACTNTRRKLKFKQAKYSVKAEEYAKKYNEHRGL